MPTPVFTATIFAIIIFGAILGGIFDGGGVGTSDLNTVMQFQILKQQEGIFGLRIPVPNDAFFSAAGNLLVWNFSFFEGVLNYVRLAILVPLSIAFGFGLILTLFSSFVSRFPGLGLLGGGK